MSEKSVMQARTRLLVVLAGLLLVYLAGAYGGLLDGKVLSWWSDFFWTFAALAAAWRCWRTAGNRSMRHERLAWNLFGLAAFSWFVGMLVWDYLFFSFNVKPAATCATFSSSLLSRLR